MHVCLEEKRESEKVRGGGRRRASDDVKPPETDTTAVKGHHLCVHSCVSSCWCV